MVDTSLCMECKLLYSIEGEGHATVRSHSWS